MEKLANILGIAVSVAMVVVLRGFMLALQLHWAYHIAAVILSGLIGATVTTVHRIYGDQ